MCLTVLIHKQLLIIYFVLVIMSTGSSSIARSTSANTDGEVQTPASVSNDNGTATNGAVDELIYNIRRTAEHEVRSRILPIITSIPPPDRPELIRCVFLMKMCGCFDRLFVCILFIYSNNHLHELSLSKNY